MPERCGMSVDIVDDDMKMIHWQEKPESDLNSTESDAAYVALTGGRYNDSLGKNDTLANVQQLNKVCVSAFSAQTNEPVRTSDDHMALPTRRVIRPANILRNLTAQKQEQSSTSANSTLEMFFKDAQYELVTLIHTKGAAGSVSGPYGYRHTLTSFGIGEESKRAAIRIDFIMPLESGEVDIKVHHYAVLSNRFDDGLYIIDHRPVLARVPW